DPAPTNASASASAPASASASASGEKVAAVPAIPSAASEVAPPADAAPLRAADRPSTVVPPTPPGPPSFAAAAPASSTARDEAARTLAAEVALVDRARSLAHVSPMRAIAVLDEHAQTFPTGALRDEAAVVRLEALLAAGLRSEAERHAQPFLRDRAHTPMARRMADLLGKTNVPIP
ncbi:MAG TPA: hypothetical protein VLT33_39040, partial [Labilithrix sp.]|nr:hypothetical protein [Labilithrix sp.]